MAKGYFLIEPKLSIPAKAALIECYRRLKEDTPMFNHSEKGLKRLLLRRGVEALYEAVKLPVRMNGVRASETYLPDFLLHKHRVGGRSIVIDFHGGYLLTMSYLERLQIVRQTYGLFVVLSSNQTQQHIANVVGADVSRYVDGFWHFDGKNADSVAHQLDKVLGNAKTGKSVVPHLLEVAQRV